MAPPPTPCSQATLSRPAKQAELGYTLQTLIVTAAVVLMAAVASTVLWGVTRGSRDNAEEAGRIGVEARCSPNEVRNMDLESKGLEGSNRILNAEITADAVGCYPVCGTWEYYDPGLAAAGTGGPQGNGGIYSSDIGCFAPCYWNHDFPEKMWRPNRDNAVSKRTWLSYHDDNRPPGINQIRLGVNYRRRPASELADLPDLDEVLEDDTTKIFALLTQANDLMMIPMGPMPRQGSQSETADRKPYIHTRTISNDPDQLGANVDYLHTKYQVPKSYDLGGSRYNAGELPLHHKQIEAGFPTVFKPNWITRPKPPMDPGGKKRNDNDWEDENWEYRADPHKEVCTIVNITLDDKVVCSSEWENCPREYIPNREIIRRFRLAPQTPNL